MSEKNKEETLFFTFDATAGEAAQLVGPLEENLRRIEAAFQIKIHRRGTRFTLTGEKAAGALRVLELCAGRILSGDPIRGEDVDLACIGEAADGKAGNAPEAVCLKTRKAGLKPRTPHQREYLKALLTTDITFGIGPAGTGKTYLAVAAAVDAYERNVVERIVLTRPAVEAGERLGFLPGDLAQKVDPYLRPLYDALYDLLGFERTQRLIEKQIIEIAPLAYMRGRTLNNAFVILDEAQNTTREQMKMFLTRIGFGSKVVVTGDATQKDLPKGTTSGLDVALKVLKKVEGISICELTNSDVVRHPLVQKIVQAYDAYEKRESKDSKNKRKRTRT